MKHVRTTFRSLSLRLTGWLCLFAFLAAGAELLPGLVTLALSFDDDHTVTVVTAGERMDLILHHAPTVLEVDHDHGFAESVLLLFAGGGETGHGDHILHLAKVGKMPRGEVAPVSAWPPQIVAPVISEVAAGIVLPEPQVLVLAVARPPPWCPAALRGLRSTVLMI